jgi:hypothetical protein
LRERLIKPDPTSSIGSLASSGEITRTKRGVMIARWRGKAAIYFRDSNGYKLELSGAVRIN